MDTNMLMMMMLMGGGRSNNMMSMLMLMMLMGGNTGTNPFGTIGTTLGVSSQQMMIGLIPGLSLFAKGLIGGTGAMIGAKLMSGFAPKRRKRRTRVVYRNRYPRYRRRY